MNQFVKQAYVQGLAARAILRARIMQKRAGIGDYAMAGGIGAGGGALIGALINYARKKNMLSGALAGAGVGGVAGLGYQGIKDLLKKSPEVLTTKGNKDFWNKINDDDSRTVDTGVDHNGQRVKIVLPKGPDNPLAEPSSSGNRYLTATEGDREQLEKGPVYTPLGEGLSVAGPRYTENPNDLPTIDQDLPGLSNDDKVYAMGRQTGEAIGNFFKRNK